MADDNKTQEQPQAQNKDIKPVCSLSVPTIIFALHQNALSHCDAASKGIRLLNSAINDDKDGELKSAGEHIISAIPSEKGKGIDKKNAIETIKQYVQWFVGPDLANKINDSTVKSLNENPGTAPKKPDDKSKSDSDKKLNENINIISFKSFLLESGDDSDDETGEGDDDYDETGAGDDSDDETGAGEDDDDETGAGEDDDDDSGAGEDDDDDSGAGDDSDDESGTDGKPDESKESEVGYYVAYNLKVEGLKSTTLKDAMKKFAATLFDNLKISSDGLFGGSQSFTIGDVKKAVGDLFGGIDPNDLKDNITKSLKKYSDNIAVDTLSKEKIMRSYKKQLDVRQKAAIDATDTSITIQVPKDVKKELNPRIIADVVTSSIKGLFKKFKHQIKKDDVIKISVESRDGSNNDTDDADENLKKPSPEKFERMLTRNFNNYVSVYDRLSSLVDKIKSKKDFENNEFAKKFVELCDKQKKSAGDLIYDQTDLKDKSVKTFVDHFKGFLADYSKLYDEYKDVKPGDKPATISETDDMIRSIIYESVMRRFYGNIDRHRDRIKTKNDIMTILLGPEYQLAEDEDEEIEASDNTEEIDGATTGDDEEEESSGSESSGSGSSSESSGSSSSSSSPDSNTKDDDNTDDLYIIPMKALKSKDD